MMDTAQGTAADQGMTALVNQRLEALRQMRLTDTAGTRTGPTYKCQKCRDTGWEEAEEDNGYSFMRECSCGLLDRQKLKMGGILKFAAIPKEFENQTVDSFRTDCYSTPYSRERAEMAKSIAKKYVEQFDEIKETGKGLYFYSSVKGSGKTRLAVSIANDLIRQKMVSAKFATTLQILDQIKATYGEKKSGDGGSEQRLIHDIISVPVLVVDDIGVENVNGWVNERFYSILNGRMIEKRITFFTSNCRPEDLKFDERIVNRIMKMALDIEFPAESIRALCARKENSDLLDRLIGK